MRVPGMVTSIEPPLIETGQLQDIFLRTVHRFLQMLCIRHSSDRAMACMANSAERYCAINNLEREAV